MSRPSEDRGLPLHGCRGGWIGAEPVTVGRVPESCPDRFERGDRRRELLEQAGWATRELLANQVMRWGVPESKGHDDLLNALALVVQADPLAAMPVASGRRTGAAHLIASCLLIPSRGLGN
jgi:hypothetical protein